MAASACPRDGSAVTGPLQNRAWFSEENCTASLANSLLFVTFLSGDIWDSSDVEEKMFL